MKIQFTLLLLACAATALAQEHFDSPEAAAQAVIDAAARHDAARLAAIFGPSAKEILTSGNAGQDQAEQSEFARLAQQKHQLEPSPMNPNRVILAIGEEDWPFPVPLARRDGKWSFDASQAPSEMRARRIGTDELDVIEVCRGFVQAQRKYASQDRDKDGLLEYAAHLRSTPGHHDGLYWESSDPLIPEAFAKAAWEGTQRGNAQPYHGYFFRILDAQAPDARGGAHAYRLKNRLIGGFALVAWPAEYEVTGIHTFIVNQDGTVYQKDIPPPPGRGGIPISVFNPDHSWDPVE